MGDVDRPGSDDEPAPGVADGDPAVTRPVPPPPPPPPPASPAAEPATAAATEAAATTGRSSRDLRPVVIGLGAVVLALGGVLVGLLVAGGDDDATPPPTTVATVDPTTATTSAPTTAAPDPTAPSTTVARSFADLFEVERAAVARVDVVGCSFSGQGTAFLIGPDLAVTAWHVVDGATQIGLTVDGGVVDGRVIGHDPERDVALLRLSRSVDGIDPLRLGTELPRVGEEVAAMGHPRGQPLALTVGRVTSMNGTFDFGTPDFPDVVEDLIQTDAVVAPGNSGGPLIDTDGDVIGVVVLRDGFGDGLMWATDIQATVDAIDRWTTTAEPVDAAFCLGEVDLDAETDFLVGSDVDHPEIDAIRRTYGFTALGINSGRADEAYEALGPSLRARFTAEEWAAGQETSFVWAYWVREVTDVDADTLRVRIAFTSTQEPQFGRVPGETCTRWDLIHTLVRGEIRGEPFWLVDAVELGPTGPTACAAFVPDVVEAGTIELPAPGSSVTVDGSLAWGTLARWQIDLDVDDLVTIRLDATEGTFDAFLRVVAPDGTIIAENDDRGDGSLNSEVSGVTVPAAGTYLVEVRDLSDDDAGPYRLEVIGGGTVG